MRRAVLRDCNTVITKIDCDWVAVKNECRVTVNKDPTEKIPAREFKQKLLISEHSPIRLLRVKWSWQKIKSWIATHFARHWIGWQKWIGTRRTDRTGIDRDDLKQGELIPMDIEANAQAMINVSRVRLCRQSAPETREYMEDLKRSIRNVEPEISDVMVPNCVYRGGCPEFSPCAFWVQFVNRHKEGNLLDIKDRYTLYNDDFNGGVINN